MLVVSGCDEHHKVGEFYDTIASSNECVVRFKAWDIGQKMVFVSKTFDELKIYCTVVSFSKH